MLFTFALFLKKDSISLKYVLLYMLSKLKIRDWIAHLRAAAKCHFIVD